MKRCWNECYGRLAVLSASFKCRCQTMRFSSSNTGHPGRNHTAPSRQHTSMDDILRHEFDEMPGWWQHLLRAQPYNSSKLAQKPWNYLAPRLFDFEAVAIGNQSKGGNTATHTCSCNLLSGFWKWRVYTDAASLTKTRQTPNTGLWHPFGSNHWRNWLCHSAVMGRGGGGGGVSSVQCRMTLGFSVVVSALMPANLVWNHTDNLTQIISGRISRRIINFPHQ